jgi:hypothetical protein
MCFLAPAPVRIMAETLADTYQPALLQAQHWTAAARRLANLDALASDRAWESLEQYLHFELRKKLAHSVGRLIQMGEDLTRRLIQQNPYPAAGDGQQELERLRSQYLKVETMLDFFASALATRTNPQMVALLRACDRMAATAMKALLEPLGLVTPPVLVYLTGGRGASILKAGLQLWDGHTSNPVAAIKVVRHNLLRPTALIHEAGHQVAHMTHWNEALATGLRTRLRHLGADVAETWASWASEIAADIFAFVHTGFAAVASLHDVVDGPSGSVFRFVPGDPHPISYLRVLLGVECCRRCFGEGPWNELRATWLEKHPLPTDDPPLRSLLQGSVTALPLVAELALQQPLAVFRGQALQDIINPAQVHPARLAQAAQSQGGSYYRSHFLLAENPLQKLAWNGYQVVTTPNRAEELLLEQQEWMLLLGKSIV